MHQYKMKKMHYMQRSLIFVSSYYSTIIIADWSKSLHARHPSTIALPSTMRWAGGRGALLRALPVPPRFGQWPL